MHLVIVLLATSTTTKIHLYQSLDKLDPVKNGFLEIVLEAQAQKMHPVKLDTLAFAGAFTATTLALSQFHVKHGNDHVSLDNFLPFLSRLT